MSTSRGWALWANDLQNQFAPDALRYYLAASAPEGRDTSWYWSEFVRRNNDELVATWGNLVHRVLNIAHRHFGRVPEAGTLVEADHSILTAGAESFQKVGALLDSIQIKAALQEALSLAQSTNQYISEQEPWRLVKANPERAQAVVHTGLQLVDYLKILLCPFLPFSSQQLHEMLGYIGTIAPQPSPAEALDPDGQVRQVLTGNYRTLPVWRPLPIPVGQVVTAPSMLFKKLDLSERSDQ
jgi:methionyl-tRNA synthetase